MAEAFATLGIAASIAQFVSLGAQFVERLQDFHSRAVDIPLFLQDMSDQIPLLVRICEIIHQNGVDENDKELLRLIRGCIKHVSELDKLSGNLAPSVEDNRFRRTQKAIRSMWIEKKLRAAQGSLETYKTSLILYHELSSNTSIAPSKFNQGVCHSFPTLSASQLVKRKELLMKMRKSLTETSNAGPRVVILIGMGGQGKTSLAVEYCRESSERSQYEVILWINATSYQTMLLSFGACANLLSTRRQSIIDLKSAVAFVIEALNGKSWLMVFDSYDRPKEIGSITGLYPNSGNGAVLVTSRHTDTARLGNALYVTKMEDDEGIELLLSRTSYEKEDPKVWKEGIKIVSLLGYLPLAIDQAGAYIAARNLPLPLFTKHYEDRKEMLLTLTPTCWDYTRKLSEEEENETPVSIFTTWEMSLQQISDTDNIRESVQHMLTIAAFFDRSNISEKIFQQHTIPATASTNWISIFSGQYSFQDVLAELAKLSLVQELKTSSSECCFALHPLVGDWIQLRIPSSQRETYAIEASQILANFTKRCLESGSKKIVQDALLHQDALLLHSRAFLEPENGIGVGALRESGHLFAVFYNSHGRYDKAAGLFGTIFEDDRRRHGVDHAITIGSACDLADAYTNDSRYCEARELLASVLERGQSKYGDEDPEILRAMTGLASVHAKQDRLLEARKLYEKALSAFEKQPHRFEMKALQTLEKLAQIYRFYGKHSLATTSYMKVLQGYERELDKNDPKTVGVVVGLAHVYRGQALYSQAQDLYERAWHSLSEIRGPDHPQTTETLVNLAIACRNQGQWPKAEYYLVLALESFHKLLGPTHLDTLRALMNLALVYDKQGQTRQASALYERVLQGREKKLGLGHSHTLRTVERLVYMLWQQERRKEAEELALRVMVATEKVTPLEMELWTKDSVYNFMAMERLYTQAVVREEQKLAADHIDLREARECLVAIKNAQTGRNS